MISVRKYCVHLCCCLGDLLRFGALLLLFVDHEPPLLLLKVGRGVLPAADAVDDPHQVRQFGVANQLLALKFREDGRSGGGVDLFVYD